MTKCSISNKNKIFVSLKTLIICYKEAERSLRHSLRYSQSPSEEVSVKTRRHVCKPILQFQHLPVQWNHTASVQLLESSAKSVCSEIACLLHRFRKSFPSWQLRLHPRNNHTLVLEVKWTPYLHCKQHQSTSKCCRYQGFHRNNRLIRPEFLHTLFHKSRNPMDSHLRCWRNFVWSILCSRTMTF